MSRYAVSRGAEFIGVFVAESEQDAVAQSIQMVEWYGISISTENLRTPYKAIQLVGH